MSMYTKERERESVCVCRRERCSSLFAGKSDKSGKCIVTRTRAYQRIDLIVC